MNNLIIKAKNKEEVKELVLKNFTLAADETYDIIEIKKPTNLIFFTLSGKYEIIIRKKGEVKKQVVKENKKVQKKEDKDNIDSIITKKFNDFVNTTMLDVKLKKIETNDKFKTLIIEGKDVRFFIGEKGTTLTALENLFNNISIVKPFKIGIDSNGYKEKREETLRAMANKKAQKVIETKSSCKLSSLTARERKIVHEEVSKYPMLKTESFGEEPKRYLVIKYKEGK